uniref:Uncharacterized protein n=1 Tax=Tanacetum cinerariifolium TaxID=118510 RepID=A0A6L2NK83_TANCI|nr:hypothetical protein [Tanacetum cinerariifolium]
MKQGMGDGGYCCWDGRQGVWVVVVILGTMWGLLLGWTTGIIVKNLTIASHLHMANNETYIRSPSEVCLSDSDSELLRPTPCQEEKEVPLNNNIGKQIGAFVDMHSEAVEQGMDDNVPDKIDGAKGK